MTIAGLSRVVVTQPPPWGKEREAAAMAWEVFESLGLSLFKLDIALLMSDATEAIAAHLADLRAFAPQAAIATPNAGYALNAMVEGRNVFLDLLQIPTLVTWDSVVQFPVQLMGGNVPPTPKWSQGGMVERTRAVMNHPLLFHAAYDRRQIADMEELGLIEPGRVVHTPVFAYQKFIDHGLTWDPAASMIEQVAFTGTITTGGMDEILARQPVLPAIEQRAIHERGLLDPVWQAFLAAIDAFPEEVRLAHKMDRDQSYFWRLAWEIMSCQANPHDRGKVLGAIRHPVAYYGRLNGPQGQLTDMWPRVTYRGDLDMLDELPQLNARTAITVDVVNRIFPSGFTAKIASCFAAGGFCLLDWRPEFLDVFGEAGAQVMYRDTDELNGLIDHFLSHPRARAELADHLGQQVRERLPARKIYADLLLQLVERHRL